MHKFEKREFKVGDLVYITDTRDQPLAQIKLTYDIEFMRSVEVGTIVSTTFTGSYDVKFWAFPEDTLVFYDYEMTHATL